jgi:Uma2 family endonuclease
MGSVPHRNFTSVERTEAPAFSESRAGNRPDLVGEGNHDCDQYAFPAAPAQNWVNTQANRLASPRGRRSWPPETVLAKASLVSSMHPGMSMNAAMPPDLVRRHRLTVEEYFRMAEVGLLAPEARVELIEGEIFDMAPIGTQHGGLTAWLHRRFLRDLGEKISVWNQVTLPLGKFSAPEPDLVILKYRKDEYRNKQPLPDDVLLVVEVSQSSLRHDRTVKVPLYARHEIPEVWILDVQRPQLQFFHTLEVGRYTHTSSTPTPGQVALRALPGAVVDLTGLFED